MNEVVEPTTTTLINVVSSSPSSTASSSTLTSTSLAVSQQRQLEQQQLQQQQQQQVGSTTSGDHSPNIHAGGTASRVTTIYVEEIQGRNINEKDVFVKFKVDGKKFKTKTQKKTANPLWNEKFTVTTTSRIDDIEFTVHSQNILGNNVDIGSVKYVLQVSNKPIVNGASTITTATSSNKLAPPTPTSATATTAAAGNSSDTSSESSATGSLIDSYTIDQWMPMEKTTSELKVLMVIRIRDIVLLNDTDTSSSASTEDGVVTPATHGPAHSLSRQRTIGGDSKEHKDMSSFIGKGGSQIKKLTKRITAKMEKGSGGGSSLSLEAKKKDERMAIIEEQLAKERTKELEKEAIEREKERAREKLRQREEEEQQRQRDKERQEERRKAKEAKQKKEKETRFQPTRPIDFFFVVGCSTKLEPIDNRYETVSRQVDPLEMAYKGELLDFYPPRDEEILPNHIWMYCFPKGATLTKEEQAPSFFPFVLTNETGVRFYGSCLTFYELASDDMVSEVKKRRGSSNTVDVQQQVDGGSAQTPTMRPSGGSASTASPLSLSQSGYHHPSTVYAPKCICILSHYPFYGYFRVCLNDIYQKVFFSPAASTSLSSNSNALPIERTIYNIVQEVALPVQGVNSVVHTVNNTTITLRRPPDCLLPMSELPYSLLFKCLDIKSVILLFKCILLEQKIVIISDHYSLLTLIAEIVSSLLHPFSWPHVYVPILPELLLEYIYSPFPFIMGVHKSYSHSIMTEENLLNEIVVVDLDNNHIMIPQSQTTLNQASMPERETTQLINQLRRVLQYELLASDLPNFNLNSMSPMPAPPNTSSASTNTGLRSTQQQQQQQQQGGRPHFHSAPAPPSSASIDDHIRLSFLQFFCSIMCDYRRHLKYLRVFPKPITLFNRAEFIKSRTWPSSQDNGTFYTALVDSQAFSFFLDQHNWPKTNLFDYLIETQKYKRPVEELCAQYYTTVHQGLGVLEQSKYTTVHAPAPSALRRNSSSASGSGSSSSSNNNTSAGKECIRFPQLKQDAMATPQASVNKPASVAIQAKEVPVSMEIYSNSISIGDSVLSLQQDGLPSKIIEEQYKSFVAIIEQLIDRLGSDAPPESSDIQQVLELLKFDSGRQLFGRLLMKHQKNSAGENVPIKARLSDALFYCLGDLLKAALREANTHSDFASTRMYLEASFVYHRLANGSNEHVSERLRNQDIWQNYNFWEQFFYDTLEHRCRMLYGNIIREMIKWGSYTTDKQDKLKQEEKDMEFSLLSKMVYYMINLGSQPDLVRRFVNKMCSRVSFDADRTDTMMQVVSNITRARDIQDMDQIDANKATTVAADASSRHIQKEMSKSTKAKDIYLPVGLRHVSTNEGIELLTHLIDEKSSNIVAQRNNNAKIMNLRSAWAETRSKTSAKLDYRDISENRGDYIMKTFTGHKEGVLCLALVAHGHKETNALITGSADSTLKVWDMTSTRCLGTLEGHGGWVNSIEVGADSKVFSSSYDKTIKLWDLSKCAKIKSFRGHKGSISCLRIFDSHQIISGSYDNTIGVWDDRASKPSATLVGHQQPIMTLVCDGYKVISGSRDTNIRIWDIRTMSTLKILSGHSDWIKCMEHDMDTLLTGSCDGKVKVWSVESGECLRTLQGHSGSINSLLLHRGDEDDNNQRKFITASADSTLQVWDSNYAESYHTLSGHTDEVMGVKSFINSLVVSGSYDGTVKLWDVNTGRAHRTIHNHTNRISSLETNESTIITGSWDKTAKACVFGLDFRT
ncbi:hypothetical protein SAMD00019534_018070 [Acytostelium subglobosum LB1]|uniref:hypothetical protein n=1 Tax=Acytostelium subglobosum LB1 TaxID=1410327 RepID=UPI000644C329|nr:hypothetical protein SAMD00019534_018070 [Acytostelium subglobosum LB1]GAM18632.1 hypothetical protein SAMD00019534_018070 [Acytostelium subglobosum LB1]|eukprot:XP_012757852.1 hypothetical protein SAMD00019534_018070 [Acytostelium subglobosum LB1]